MKRFFLEAGILAILLIITYLGLTTYVERHFPRTNSYMAMSLAKEQRLTSLKGPKLLLLGGSNLLFGFDSNLLQPHRQAKVVNMGLHAGLGLPFVLNQSIAQVGKNDTIILCPEYYVDKGDVASQTELLSVNPGAQPYLDYDLFDVLRLYAAKFQKCVSVPFSFLGKAPETPRTYRIENMNEFGDIKQLYSEDIKPLDTKEVFSGQVDDIYTARINKFIDEAKLRGATVYFTFPPLCASGFTLNKKSVLRLGQLFKENLHCQVLGSVSDFVYPDNYFFDTIYHLKSEARAIRTKRVIQLLDRSNGTASHNLAGPPLTLNQASGYR